MRERGLDVDHSTIFRWVQRYAPEINKRIRPHLKLAGVSYRIDETYIKISTGWSTSMAQWIKKAIRLNSCEAQSAILPRQNASLRR
jgi:transposase-like protein